LQNILICPNSNSTYCCNNRWVQYNPWNRLQAWLSCITQL